MRIPPIATRLPWAAAGALLIGLLGFVALERDSALGPWRAPESPEEMRELVREALLLEGGPGDPRLERLDRFVLEAGQLQHWQRRGPEPRGPAWTRAELGAFLRDASLFYNDEWHKVSETYYYQLFFEQRDLDSPDWSANLAARTNPTLAKFLLGGGIDLQLPGPHPIRTLAMQEIFDRWWAFELFLLAGMDREVLRAGRRTSAAFGAGCVALLFLLGRRLGGRVGLASGGLAAALLLATPFFRYYASRATVDVMLLFFLLCAGLATTWFVPCALSPGPYPRRSRWRLASATLALGVATGLASCIKLNGALVGIGAALGCALGWLAGRTARGADRDAAVASPRRWGAALAAAAALAVVIFVASNPHFHQHPLARIQRTLREMGEEIARAQRQPGPAIASRLEAARATFHYAAMTTGHYGRAMLTRSAEPPFEPMTHVPVVAPLRFWLRTALVVGGLLLEAVFLYTGTFGSAARDGKAGLRFGLIGWALALIAGSILWLPLRWDRYLLVPLAPGAILVAHGWCSGIAWLIRRARGRRASAPIAA